MKINILLVVLLVLVGLGIGYKYYDNSRVVNSDSYVSTLSVINELKHADSDLNTLVLKSRYGLQDDYDDLANRSVELNKTFDELKESDITLYYSRSKELENVVRQYEEALILKTDLVENFKSHNAVLRNSIKYAPILGERLIAMLDDKQGEQGEQDEQVETLKKLNQALYRWALYTTEEEARIIQANARSVLDLMPLFENQVPVIEYNAHVLTVVDEQAQTQKYLENALGLQTQTLLSSLESSYTEQYLALVDQTSKLRYVTLLYGLICLLAASYFVWLLRRSYGRLEQKVEERTREINEAYEKLQDSQEQLVQSEKMASLGQMVAGIAHEINTPLAYVNNNVSVVKRFFVSVGQLMQGLGKVYQDMLQPQPAQNKRKLAADLTRVLKQYKSLYRDEMIDEAKELLVDSAHGLENISDLVTDLRDFARLEKQELSNFDVRDGLQSTLKIAGSVLKEHDVEVVRKYAAVPELDCVPSKLNQVFLNIITNAAQAMPDEGGSLTITVKEQGNNVVISFEDSGMGMNDEVRAKVFDPFFTTKPVGEGTGLGLSISYTIIKEHGGTIDVLSSEGEGATFTITLPLKAE